MAPYHILIVMIRYVNSEILVVLTKSEQFGPKSAHIRPTILCFLPWELYPLDPQIFYVLFQILYIRFTPYTFSLFNLIMA